jgi:F-type H+-transporting ATPase subunit delta
MNESKIPVRYARALFLFGKEKEMLEKIAGDATLFMEFYQKTPSLVPWLRSPLVSTREKKELLRQHFESRFSEITLKFIDLVLTKRRERYFPDIFRYFIHLHKTEAGIKTIILTTAVEIDEITARNLSLRFEQEGKPPNEIIKRVKPSIIGGFMLQIDDTLYDGSVSTELARLKNELASQVREDTVKKSRI